MSIWTELEEASKQDVDLLNQAMVLLYTAAAQPTAEKYFKDRVKKLEKKVQAHRQHDHRFSNCSIVYDANALAKVIRGELP